MSKITLIWAVIIDTLGIVYIAVLLKAALVCWVERIRNVHHEQTAWRRD